MNHTFRKLYARKYSSITLNRRVSTLPRLTQNRAKPYEFPSMYVLINEFRQIILFDNKLSLMPHECSMAAPAWDKWGRGDKRCVGNHALWTTLFFLFETSSSGGNASCLLKMSFKCDDLNNVHNPPPPEVFSSGLQESQKLVPHPPPPWLRDYECYVRFWKH